MMITPYILYTLLVFALAGCVALFTLYAKQRRGREKLEEKMRVIMDWVHDIRTPVSLVKASLGELEARKSLTDKDRKALDVALKNVDKLLALAVQLLDWQKAELYVPALRVTPCDIACLLNSKARAFQYFASGKALTLQVSVQADMPTVWIDREKIERILDNLLGNALKYTNEGGSVTLRGEAGDDHWTLQVSDTGIGIPKEEQPHILKECYRAHNASDATDVGTGIGLLLTRRLVEQHQGTITFDSVEGRGTTFTLTFPLKPKGAEVVDDGGEASEVFADNGPTSVPDAGETPAPAADEGKNVLLLAEDDPDMRRYLEDALSAEYRVVAVPDGKQALEKAREINPDIIISDIMMPALKGDELCRILKSSVDTSHIPVVLLTALGEREDIIYGLEAGANDYIIKPFDLSVLKARLRNVLQNRQRFRSAVLLMEKGEEEDIDYSSQLDKEFLDKVMGIISQEMSNPSFSVNDFCRMVGMSRTSLYNKLKPLTGQGPQDFIRIMRLNKAKELLKTRRHTIGEVSALVGFSDPKYFSTCFKKQFGISPSKM